MTIWTFILLLIVFGWIGSMQLLNSDSKSGELARAFASGLIQWLVGPRCDCHRSNDNTAPHPKP